VDLLVFFTVVWDLLTVFIAGFSAFEEFLIEIMKII
jgi:hypothetical protein